MGSRIAAHFANAGLPVILLDIVAPGASSNDKAARNKLVDASLLRRWVTAQNKSPEKRTFSRLFHVW